MDRKSEEFQAMGIFGVYREAYKVTMSWKKIFSQISIALILPLAFMFLAQIEISELLLNKILSNLKYLEDGNPNYNKILSQLIVFKVLDAIFMLFLFVFSLLSTSAIGHTVACVYSSRETSFKRVMSVVPKLWKRLMHTFLWNFFIVFLYYFSMVLVIVLLALLYHVLSKILTIHIDANSPVTISVILMITIIPYMIGVMYVSLVWFLASVITILEDIRGMKAIEKGRNLIKGKLWISRRIYAMIIICSAAIHFAFRKQVVHGGDSLAMVGRVSLGICYLLLLVILIHFGLVTQTIVYFVCKSYHKENIDIADHLDGYYYVPLREDQDFQLAGNSV